MSRVIESIFELQESNFIKRVVIHLHNFRNYDGHQLIKIGVCDIIIVCAPLSVLPTLTQRVSSLINFVLIREYQVILPHIHSYIRRSNHEP